MGTIILVRKIKNENYTFCNFFGEINLSLHTENLDFLEDEPINTVPKNLNPPNAPQIQPI